MILVRKKNPWELYEINKEHLSIANINTDIIIFDIIWKEFRYREFWSLKTYEYETVLIFFAGGEALFWFVMILCFVLFFSKIWKKKLNSPLVLHLTDHVILPHTRERKLLGALTSAGDPGALCTALGHWHSTGLGQQHTTDSLCSCQFMKGKHFMRETSNITYTDLISTCCPKTNC